jgi:hypothetical protein
MSYASINEMAQDLDTTEPNYAAIAYMACLESGQPGAADFLDKSEVALTKNFLDLDESVIDRLITDVIQRPTFPGRPANNPLRRMLEAWEKKGAIYKWWKYHQVHKHELFEQVPDEVEQYARYGVPSSNHEWADLPSEFISANVPSYSYSARQSTPGEIAAIDAYNQRYRKFYNLPPWAQTEYDPDLDLKIGLATVEKARNAGPMGIVAMTGAVLGGNDIGEALDMAAPLDGMAMAFGAAYGNAGSFRRYDGSGNLVGNGLPNPAPSSGYIDANPKQWGAPVRDYSAGGNARFFSPGRTFIPSMSPMPVAPIFAGFEVPPMELWRGAAFANQPIPVSFAGPALPQGARITEPVQFFSTSQTRGDVQSNYMFYSYQQGGRTFKVSEGRLPALGDTIFQPRGTNPEAPGQFNQGGDIAAHLLSNRSGGPEHPLNLSSLHPNTEQQFGQFEDFLDNKREQNQSQIDLRVIDVFEPGSDRPSERRVEWTEHLPGGGVNIGGDVFRNQPRQGNLPPPVGQRTQAEDLLSRALTPRAGQPLTDAEINQQAAAQGLSPAQILGGKRGLENRNELQRQPDGRFVFQPPQAAAPAPAPAGVPGFNNLENRVYALLPADGSEITQGTLIVEGRQQGLSDAQILQGLHMLENRGAAKKAGDEKFFDPWKRTTPGNP